MGEESEGVACATWRRSGKPTFRVTAAGVRHFCFAARDADPPNGMQARPLQSAATCSCSLTRYVPRNRGPSP